MLYRTTVIKKRSRRLGLILLVLLLIATSGAALTNARQQASAAESNTYPWDDAADANAANYDWGYDTCPTSAPSCKTLVVNGKGVYDPWNYEFRNCTSYVAYRISQEFNGLNIAGWGNAIDFDDNAVKNGYSINGSPQVGDIAQWNTGVYGHVAYVYAVSNGVASIAEYNQQGTGRYRNDRTVATNGANFIHIGTPTGTGGGSTVTSTAIGSQVTPDGVQHVYKGTSDGRVWEVTWGNGTLAQWTPGANLGGPVTAISSQLINGYEQHVYAAVGQNVWEIVWGGGATYGQWKPVINIGANVMGLSSTSTGTATQHIFARAGDKVWEAIWGGGATYAVYTPTPGGGLGTPKAGGLSVQVYNGQNHVYTLSTDGNLWEVAWGNGASGAWVPLSGLGGSDSGISSQLVNGTEQHIYAGANDGKIWAVRWGGGSTYAVWNPASGLGGAVTSISSSITGTNVENVYASVGQNVWHTSFTGTSTIGSWTPGTYLGAVQAISSKVTAGPSGPTHHVYSTNGSNVVEIGWGGGATFVQQQVGSGL